jgi:hypothetical protein
MVVWYAAVICYCWDDNMNKKHDWEIDWPPDPVNFETRITYR